MVSKSVVRWSILVSVVFALILLPFMLFGEQIEAWTHNFVQSATAHPTEIMLVLGGLLAGDVFLPVPSSLASTAAGFVLGFFKGLLTSWFGMTFSCALGFWVGQRFGRPVANRLVGAGELQSLERLTHKYGDWAILVSRPVPMLAEASVLFAGISEMPWWRFMLLSTLSNLGISAVYAAVGAFSSDLNSFLLAFFGAIAVPAVAMWLMQHQAPSRAELSQR